MRLRFNHWKVPMNAGKKWFAQAMDFLPCKCFGRMPEHQRDYAGVRMLCCTELFRIMAFAQLTGCRSCGTSPRV